MECSAALKHDRVGDGLGDGSRRWGMGCQESCRRRQRYVCFGGAHQVAMQPNRRFQLLKTVEIQVFPESD